MTVDYTVKILAPAKASKLIARGRVVHAGRSTTLAAADVFSAARAGSADATAETLCATALVTMRNIKLPRPSC